MGRVALLLSLVLALPASAGRRDREETAFLHASCGQGRDPVELRLPSGVLPAAPDGLSLVALPDDRIVIDRLGEQPRVAGLPVRTEAVASSLHQLSARRPTARLILAGPAEAPASPQLAPLAHHAGIKRILVALENVGASRPSSPDATISARIVQGRAAIRDQVADPFSRLAALEELPLQVGLPRGDCPVFRGVLRTPLDPDADCEERVVDALRALAACDLDREDRTRAVAALGETWSPSDRAELVFVELDLDALQRAADASFGEAVLRALQGDAPREKRHLQ